MQLAHEMKKRRMLLRARWVPRLQNQEADDLTNDEVRHFVTKRRIDVDVEKLGFSLMGDLFKAGDAYTSELETVRNAMKLKAELKTARDVSSEKQDAKRRRPLRESDPWM